MLNNLLYEFKLFNSGIETGLFVFVLGMIIVFLGMAIIVAVITIIGKIMTAVKNKKANAPAKTENTAVAAQGAATEGVSPEVVAVITAAINAYYEKNNEKCEFAVKKIKKRG